MDLSSLSDAQLIAIRNQAQAPQPTVTAAPIPTNNGQNSGSNLSKLSDSELLTLRDKIQPAAASTSPSTGSPNAQVSTQGQNVPQSTTGALGANVNTGQLSGQDILQKVGNSSTIGAINAVGGGVATGAKTMYGLAEGFGTDMASKIGLISPIQKQALDQKAGRLGQSMLPPSYVQDSMAEHPVLKTIGEIGGGLGALATISAPFTAGLGTLGTTTGMSSVANLLMTGAMTAGDNNRAIGAIGGLVAGKAFEAAGKAVSAAASGAQAKMLLNNLADKVEASLPAGQSTKTTAIQSLINNYKIKQAAVNDLEKEFSSIPGQFEARDLQEEIQNTLTNHSDLLSPTQAAVLTKASKQLEEPQTMASLVDIKQRLNSSYRLFNSDQTPGEVSDAFNNVRQAASKQIATNMEESGNANLYQQYADKYKSTLLPLQQMNIHKLADLDPTSLKFAQQSKSLFKAMTAKGDPEQVSALMNALGQEGKQAVGAHIINTAIAKATDETGTIVNPHAFVKELQSLKGTYDVVFPSETQQMLNGVIKTSLLAPKYGASSFAKKALSYIPGGDIPGHILGALTDSKFGQLVLRSIGGSPNGNNLAKRLLDSSQSMVQQGTAGLGGFEAGNVKNKLMQ